MPVLYPDVIKLDLRLLRDREPHDLARIVTAVGAEAEQRLATVLAEGIDSEEQLADRPRGRRHARPGLPARRAGSAARPAARAGPRPAADQLRRRARQRRALPARDELAAPRPRSRCELAERAAAMITEPGRRARQHRDAARVDARRRLAPGRPARAATCRWRTGSASWRARRRGGRAQRRSAAARCRPTTRCAGTWTEVALGPGYGACFVARRTRTAAGASPPPTTARPWSSARWC